MVKPLEPSAVELDSLPLTYRQTIPDDYLDAMGHMNVMWYTHLFGRAFGGLFNLIGFTHEFMEVNQSGSFALEAHIRYFSEVHVDHSIRIHTRLLGQSEKRIHLMHFMWNESKHDLAATFEVVSAHIDMTQRRMSPFPKVIAARLAQILSEHEALEWPAPTCGTMEP